MLAATALTGVIQAVVGGQPLLIVGVAEPIVLIYKFMYEFAKDKQGAQAQHRRVGAPAGALPLVQL